MVDHCGPTRSSYERTLEGWGFEVEIAKTPQEVQTVLSSVAAFEGSPAAYEYVFVNVTAVDGSGLSLIRQIGETLPEAAIAVIAPASTDISGTGWWRYVPVLLTEPTSLDELDWAVQCLESFRKLRGPAQRLASQRNLSDREFGVLFADLLGLDEHRASAWLGIKTSTYQTYRRRLYDKLRVRSAREMLKMVIEEAVGATSPPSSHIEKHRVSGYYVLARRGGP